MLNCRRKRIDHWLNQAALELERGLIDHQARADVADVLDGDQPVGFEGAAGGDQVDDDVGQADQGEMGSNTHGTRLSQTPVKSW